MIGQEIKCQNIGCEILFSKKTHNQIYHDAECTRLATNAKIMEKYYTKRAQKLGLARFCFTCSNPLSRYNSNSVCNSCVMSREVSKNTSVIAMLTNSIVA